MKNKSILYILLLALTISFIPINDGISGEGFSAITLPQTDGSLPEEEESLTIFYVFDLRERETFIQFTYEGVIPLGDDDDSLFGLAGRAHVQIFDVSNNCNENNFFDVYTANDTHVYNMRDIVTNDGNPSGVVLPDNAYGIVVISYTTINGEIFEGQSAFGNLRIIDNNGYEYRTNGQQIVGSEGFGSEGGLPPIYTFNFNTENGVTLSDVFGVTVNLPELGDDDDDFFFEWDASSSLTAFNPFDIDILDNNETIFSCRDVTFACVDEDNPLLEELLAISGTNVASFEYGINNAIPHSKSGELLCPGNTISEGFVILNPERQFNEQFEEFFPYFLGFVGLNNGNGRGSMDSLFLFSFEGPV